MPCPGYLPACPTREETKEHCFWECPAWHDVRFPFQQKLRALGFEVPITYGAAGGGAPDQRSGCPGLWYCGLIPEDPRLDELRARSPPERVLPEEERPLPLTPAAQNVEEWEEDEAAPEGRRVVLAGDGSGLFPRD